MHIPLEAALVLRDELVGEEVHGCGDDDACRQRDAKPEDDLRVVVVCHTVSTVRQSQPSALV